MAEWNRLARNRTLDHRQHEIKTREMNILVDESSTKTARTCRRAGRDLESQPVQT